MEDNPKYNLDDPYIFPSYYPSRNMLSKLQYK
jgi:hypothetical protein